MKCHRGACDNDQAIGEHYHTEKLYCIVCTRMINECHSEKIVYLPQDKGDTVIQLRDNLTGVFKLRDLFNSDVAHSVVRLIHQTAFNYENFGIFGAEDKPVDYLLGPDYTKTTFNGVDTYYQPTIKLMLMVKEELEK